MNAQEAKKITDPNGTFSNNDPTRLFAEGYLAALEGPEVKGLLKSTRELAEFHCSEVIAPKKMCGACPVCKAKVNLANFLKAVKP